MAEKKKFKLPAIGKPKPKPKKTSARDLGKAANKQFKAGTRDKDTIPLYENNGVKVSAKDEATVQAETRRRGVSDSDSEKFMKERRNKVEVRKRKVARITGV
jgi:hypothetical protein